MRFTPFSCVLFFCWQAALCGLFFSMPQCCAQGLQKPAGTSPLPDTTHRQAWQQLTALFGPATSQGFGSGTFSGKLQAGQTIAQQAQMLYQQFLGEKYQAATQQIWMRNWALVWQGSAAYNLCAGWKTAIAGEARQSLPLLLEAGDDPLQTQAWLEQCFGQGQAKPLHLYRIGDGEALSGLILIGLFEDGNYKALVMMMD